MTIETIIDHDQPDFEPGNTPAIHALFPKPLRTARTKFLPWRGGTGGDYGAELES